MKRPIKSDQNFLLRPMPKTLRGLMDYDNELINDIKILLKGRDEVMYLIENSNSHEEKMKNLTDLGILISISGRISSRREKVYTNILNYRKDEL